MKNIREDNYGFIQYLAILENPIALGIIVFVVGLIIIVLTANDPGIAALGFLLTIAGFGGFATGHFKFGSITFPAGIILIVIGYGYIF